MASTLPKSLSRLDAERQAYLDALDAMSPGVRTSKPSTDNWSPLEIGEHVFRSDRAVLRVLEKQLDPDGEWRDYGKPSRAKFIALIGALRSPVKFKVPPNASAIEPGELTYEEIRSEWISFDEQWRKIVDSFPDHLAKSGVARHPVIGPMTLSQSLQFLAAHSARHFKQLERAMNALE